MFKGIAVSKGIAIGRAHILDRSKLCILKQNINADALEDEVRRFREAIKKTKIQMQETKKRATKVAEKYSIILDTYTLLLDDDILVNDTINKIRKEKINAEKNIYSKIEEKTTDDLIIEKPKEPKKSSSEEIDNLDKDDSINDLKKVKKYPKSKITLIQKLKNKENIKDGIILKEILKRKF